MSEIRRVVAERFLVGESPRWHDGEQALYWVDIYRPTLERLDPASGARRTWPMPERIGCFSFCADGKRIIAGMQSGIAFVDLEDGHVERVFDLAPDNPDIRFQRRALRSGRPVLGRRGYRDHGPAHKRAVPLRPGRHLPADGRPADLRQRARLRPGRNDAVSFRQPAGLRLGLGPGACQRGDRQPPGGSSPTT